MGSNDIDSKIKISFDNDFATKKYQITAAQTKLLGEMRTRVGGKMDKVLLRKIEKLSKEHSNLPQLKKYLSIAYDKMGNSAKSLETINKLILEFPDYIYGKLAAADHYIHEGMPEKALEYLGENLDLKEFLPNRSEFHFSEVQAYYFTTVLYALETEDLLLAENKFALFKENDTEDSRVEELEAMIESLRFDLEFEEEFEEEFDGEFDGEFSEDDLEFPDFSESTLNSPPTTDRIDPPVFIHTEIQQLYQLGFQNAMPVLDQILTLPRATVIQDLELVLQDGIERYPYFQNQDWSVFTHSFPLHASFLLMELKATESLTNILDFIQYDEDFMELYLGDFITEDFWQCIYILGKDTPTVLKDFLLKPGIYSFSKAAVSQALIQISILEPQRSQEIEKLFEEVLLFFINCENRDLIDPTFLALMVGDVTDAQFKNLFHHIKKLYELKYIDQSIQGNFEHFEKFFNHKSEAGSSYKLQTLAEIYYFADFCEEEEPERDFFTSFENELQISQTAVQSQKVNRNDPCPCGSGQKYKKCCGSAI